MTAGYGPVTLTPPILTSPSVGPVSPAISSNSVVLPQPLGPRTLTNAPSATAKEMLLIASIAPTHFDLARRALLAGKHVLVEKPMTLTTREALELTDLARRHEELLGEALWLDHGQGGPPEC